MSQWGIMLKKNANLQWTNAQTGSCGNAQRCSASGHLGGVGRQGSEKERGPQGQSPRKPLGGNDPREPVCVVLK